MENEENNAKVETSPSEEEKNEVEGRVLKPIEYSEGEICKCYYSVSEKPKLNDGVTLMQMKCQGYCRVVGKTEGERRLYSVEVFEPFGDKVKNLPGCCLRKVKVLPYGFEDAVAQIGKVVKSKDGKEYMTVLVVHDDEGTIRINDIEADVFMEEYVHTLPNGYPCGKIVTLTPEELFGDVEETEKKNKENQ